MAWDTNRQEGDVLTAQDWNQAVQEIKSKQSRLNVVDGLDSTSSVDVLSAKQGKVLNDRITDVNTAVENVSDKIDKLPTGIYYGQHDSEEDLEDVQVTAKGYAYIASTDPAVYYIYLYDGNSWTNSGNKFVTTNLETDLSTKSQTKAPTTKAVKEGIEAIDVTLARSAEDENELTATQKYNASANINNRAAVVVSDVVESKGYKVLNPSLPFTSQLVDGDSRQLTNTIFEIRNNFDIEGSAQVPVVVNIPANSVLRFNGGKISNCTLVTANTIIEGGCKFENVTFETASNTNGIISDVVINDDFIDCDLCSLISSCSKTITLEKDIDQSEASSDALSFKGTAHIIGNGHTIKIPNFNILSVSDVKIENVTFDCARFTTYNTFSSTARDSNVVGNISFNNCKFTNIVSLFRKSLLFQHLNHVTIQGCKFISTLDNTLEASNLTSFLQFFNVKSGCIKNNYFKDINGFILLNGNDMGYPATFITDYYEIADNVFENFNGGCINMMSLMFNNLTIRNNKFININCFNLSGADTPTSVDLSVVDVHGFKNCAFVDNEIINCSYASTIDFTGTYSGVTPSTQDRGNGLVVSNNVMRDGCDVIFFTCKNVVVTNNYFELKEKVTITDCANLSLKDNTLIQKNPISESHDSVIVLYSYNNQYNENISIENNTILAAGVTNSSSSKTHRWLELGTDYFTGEVTGLLVANNTAYWQYVKKISGDTVNTLKAINTDAQLPISIKSTQRKYLTRYQRRKVVTIDITQKQSNPATIWSNGLAYTSIEATYGTAIYENNYIEITGLTYSTPNDATSSIILDIIGVLTSNSASDTSTYRLLKTITLTQNKDVRHVDFDEPLIIHNLRFSSILVIARHSPNILSQPANFLLSIDYFDGAEKLYKAYNNNTLSTTDYPVLTYDVSTSNIVYDKGKNMAVFYDKTAGAYKDSYGFTVAAHNGDSRPTLTANDIGFPFFDTALGKPIYWNGTVWVDANGETVGLQITDTSVLIGAAQDSSKTINVYSASAITAVSQVIDETSVQYTTGSTADTVESTSYYAGNAISLNEGDIIRIDGTAVILNSSKDAVIAFTSGNSYIASGTETIYLATTIADTTVVYVKGNWLEASVGTVSGSTYPVTLKALSANSTAPRGAKVIITNTDGEVVIINVVQSY